MYDIVLDGKTYNNVPSVCLPKSGGGVAQFYSANDSLAWLGTGAELVTSFTLADVKLINTDFATWTPSSTAIDILATRTAGSFVADVVNYDYYIISQTKIPIVSDSSATKKALPTLTAANQVQMIIRRPNNLAQVKNNSWIIAVCVSTLTGSYLQYYGTTEGTETFIWSSSYGLYCSVTPAVLSSNISDTPTITVKTPKVSARCNGTYMSTANAALIDKDKTVIHQTCYVYKVKAGTGIMRGYYQQNVDLVRGVNS